MLKLVAGTAIALVLTSPAFAHSRRHHHHHHYASKSHHGDFFRSGICSPKLDNGLVIHVSCENASKFVGFLNALYHREGHLPDVTCLASGHMPHSLHHTGNACDVGQRARNVAWRAMYHVGALAEKFGLTDGCIWHNPDCGHVDVSGTQYAHRSSHERYARRAPTHYASRKRRLYASATTLPTSWHWNQGL